MCNETVFKKLRKEQINMSRMKLMFVVLLLAAIVCIVPQAQAKVAVQVTIAGSSAMWQTMALGAYNLACAGAATCATVDGIQGGHWTSNGNVVDLTDTRVTPNNVDAGTVWIVWTPGATKVWSFNKVDSVVGDRCYFAQPRCTVNGTLANLSGSGSNKIASNLWGDGSSDTSLPAAVQSLFTTGTPVTVAATDIRPEDAAFAVCRANSALGGSLGTLDGLGYNSNNAAGVCPANGLATANYVGSPIKSGLPGSTSQANVLSFNIGNGAGTTDPITGTAIPAFTVVRVGATPVVFIDEHDKGQLTGATEATDKQLQQVFSGADCDGSVVGGSGGAIQVFLREPLSGTYNATEATVMRKPAIYPGAIIGVSMETGVNATNPLANLPCTAGGGRSRGIGTSEEVTSVEDSGANFGRDGIGYTFFSYGNVSGIANKTAYGYIQLNSAKTAGAFVDPIFASYAGGDPGQPSTAGNPSPGAAGTLPAAANLPAVCGSSFPCSEKDIWTGGLSFPNLRNGTYPAWSIVRLVSNGTPLGAAKVLVTHSQKFVVDDVPDYVPALKTVGVTKTDPGLTVQRSHYQQYDGAGNFLGAAPVNAIAKEAGGDMGGCIVPTTGHDASETQSVNADFPTCDTRPATP
jgi:hypothetical protein